MRRIWVIASLFACGLVACGGGLTLTEYAGRLEAEMAVVIARIDELDAEMEEAGSVDEVRELWDERVAARERFVGAFEDLDPPANAEEIHAAASDMIERLNAEATLAARADEFETVADPGRIWDTEEGRAARAVDEEAIALCQAAQESFDETADREILADVSWMTTEMKEVVDVVFGCTSEQLNTTSGRRNAVTRLADATHEDADPELLVRRAFSCDIRNSGR